MISWRCIPLTGVPKFNDIRLWTTSSLLATGTGRGPLDSVIDDWRPQPLLKLTCVTVIKPISITLFNRHLLVECTTSEIADQLLRDLCTTTTMMR